MSPEYKLYSLLWAVYLSTWRRLLLSFHPSLLVYGKMYSAGFQGHSSFGSQASAGQFVLPGKTARLYSAKTGSFLPSDPPRRSLTWAKAVQ